MRYIALLFVIISLGHTKEGTQSVLFGVGANIMSNLEGYSEPGFGAKLGTQLGFNEYTDLGVSLKAKLSEGEAFFQYGAAFEALFTLQPGKVKPKIGGILGFQQADLAGITTNYINLGLPLQCYLALKNKSDLFVEVQPGSLVGADGNKHYVNISFGMSFKLADN